MSNRTCLYIAKPHPRDRVKFEVFSLGNDRYEIIRAGGQGRVIAGFAVGLSSARQKADIMACEEAAAVRR